MPSKRFMGYDNYIFDLDGTFWRWTELIPGAKRTYETLLKEGKPAYFMTNNCIIRRRDFLKKLAGFGIDAEERQLINPALTAVKVLKGKRVYAICEGVRQDFRAAGIRLTDSRPDAVWLSQDRRFNFEKLQKACTFIFAGAKGYKNASGGLWFMGERKVPGSGALAAAIESCTGKEMETVGKPSKHMEGYVRSLGLKGRTLLIGDECASDIAFGNRLGFDTALVLTGVDNLKACRLIDSGCRPKFVLKSVAALLA